MGAHRFVMKEVFSKSAYAAPMRLSPNGAGLESAQMKSHGNGTRTSVRIDSPSSRAGFSLAEVVVGIVIFGLAAVVLGQAVVNSLNSYRISREESGEEYPFYRVRNDVFAIPDRESVEEGGEIEVPLAIRDEEENTDTTEMVRARWEAEIHPTRILDLFVLDLAVTFEGEGDGTRSIEDSFILYRPGWSESDERERLVEAKEEEFSDRIADRNVTMEEDV